MQELTNRNHWLRKRDEYLALARKYGTKAHNPETDWLRLAKRCHRIGMGFVPVFHLTVNDVSGDVYVGA